MELTAIQKDRIQNEFYMIHEAIRLRNWSRFDNANFTMRCTPEDIIFEIDDYPGRVTKCSEEELNVSIVWDDDGITDGVVLAWASIWLDGKRSDLSMECFFGFKGEKLVHTILQQVHVF